MLAAASLVLTQAGEGSSPSGPTSADLSTSSFGLDGVQTETGNRLSATDKHWWSSGKTPHSGHRRAALVGGNEGSIPSRCSSIFDNSAANQAPMM